MVIWRGRGVFIALITLAALIVAQLATNGIMGDEQYYQTHGWPKLAGFWAAAALVYLLRSWLGVGQERILIDKATGQEVRLSAEGTLFFIPARYWPIVLLILGVIALFL